MDSRLIILAWVAIAMTGLSCIILASLLIRRLRSNHSEVWKSLGEPEIFSMDLGKRWAAHWGLTKFIIRGDYKKLGDLTVNRLARAIVCVWSAGVVMSIMWVFGLPILFHNGIAPK